MNLKIVNETAATFDEAVGISAERADELSAKMDDMVRRYAGQAVRTCHVFDEIASNCNNLEEVVYCVVSHMDFRRYHGWPMVCPPKKRRP